ncbi:MAG TPA: hypothetical protein VFU47_14270 [Armatimonadota bacterium]|nr:hypothetical protein [Armatimonadota bacterium]
MEHTRKIAALVLAALCIVLSIFVVDSMGWRMILSATGAGFAAGVVGATLGIRLSIRIIRAEVER